MWQIFLSPQTKFIWHIKIFISIEYIHNSCLWTYVATIVVFRKVFYKEREEIVQNFYFDRIKVWEKISYFHPNPYKWWNLVWALEYIEFWILRDLVVWQIYIHKYIQLRYLKFCFLVVIIFSWSDLISRYTVIDFQLTAQALENHFKKNFWEQNEILETPNLAIRILLKSMCIWSIVEEENQISDEWWN